MFFTKFVGKCNEIGKSPSAAAEEMGFQRSVVTRWSKGTAPRQATLQRIADYFGCSVAELTGEKEKPVPQDEPNKAALIAAIENMSRDELLATLEAVTQKLKENA